MHLCRYLHYLLIEKRLIGKLKIEFRKKGDGTANGANLGSGKTGGGGGGGGGSKPTPPKQLKRIDPKVRYEGTQKRIDNLKKK